MKIVSIEPTPSPNTMKIILDEELPSGKSHNYKKNDGDGAPKFIKELLRIDGIKGVYHVADFLAIDRNPKVDWKIILPEARKVFGDDEPDLKNSASREEPKDTFGEAKVFWQVFRGIPMQIKVVDEEQEIRQGLPERFMEAAMEADQKTDANMVMERKWVEKGIRYGNLEQIGKEVAEEVAALYDGERLQGLVKNAGDTQSGKEKEITREKQQVTLEMLDQPDWKDRYAALEQMDPSDDDIPVLAKALQDTKASIRRLAVVYLGMIETKNVLPYLYKALEDQSVAVRRTAGDCLSDIGDPDAVNPMVKALKDKSKLVRWRAAMFLFETGDKSALPALYEAQDDPEFEVSLQVKMAIERIEKGEAAKGSVWKQMTERMSDK